MFSHRRNRAALPLWAEQQRAEAFAERRELRAVLANPYLRQMVREEQAREARRAERAIMAAQSGA
jgi:hypothetical protein